MVPFTYLQVLQVTSNGEELAGGRRNSIRCLSHSRCGSHHPVHYRQIRLVSGRLHDGKLLAPSCLLRLLSLVFEIGGGSWA